MLQDEEKKKQVIGLYGEMQLAMKLHSLGGYIDEGIDFVISKYYCKFCKKFSNQLIRQESWEGKKAKCVTNLCEFCKESKLDIVTKYLQVKTSEGKPIYNKGAMIKNMRNFSFHPKIRYDMSLPTYQITDNQKTTLRIDKQGEILNNGKKYSYECFRDFHNNFKLLENLKA